MIELIQDTIVQNIDPLSLFIGLTFGVLGDEAGRAMFKRMANERLDQILGPTDRTDDNDSRGDE